MKPARVLVGVSFLAIAGLVLPACGGAGSGADFGSAEGEPIKIAVIGTLESPDLSQPNSRIGAEAAAKAINANGGVNGRPIEVVSCNDKGDPNTAAKCAREMVGQDVVASIGSVTRNSDQAIPIFAAADIASIGNYPATSADRTDPSSFPLGGGITNEYTGAGYSVVKYGGAEKVSLISHSAATAQAAMGYLEKGVKAAGGEVVNEVRIDLGSADSSAQVAKAVGNGAQGVVTALPSADMGQVTRSLASTGANLEHATDSFSAQPTLLESLGAAAEGMILSGDTPSATDTSVDYIKQFNDEMNAFDESSTRDSAGLMSWTATYLLADVLEGLDTIDAASVLKAMGKIENKDLFWLTGFSTTAPVSPAAPRIFNSTIFVNEWKDGKIILLDGPVALPAAALQ
ncbi:ABC transporter substrate-binding protein [Rhodococcus wratislaviensis]|uniref:Leucine-binding protein domain-containing protein n=1 Tax=Rhodococcus wratislaviensis NBRC 100605 TaxID=1219028 RepID=X0QB96_RHOWR|nr:ABC transporter substrate-binding protein [Rhodococcus wratislaviensis]GAF48882.1 hypothetical protein RW1_062_00060 [Rhodococcus wratislaviensis NBRC 100605]